MSKSAGVLMVLFESAAAPTVVLSMPVMLNKNAAAPSAVLVVGNVEKERSRASSRVEATPLRRLKVRTNQLLYSQPRW